MMLQILLLCIMIIYLLLLLSLCLIYKLNFVIDMYKLENYSILSLVLFIILHFCRSLGTQLSWLIKADLTRHQCMIEIWGLSPSFLVLTPQGFTLLKKMDYLENGLSDVVLYYEACTYSTLFNFTRIFQIVLIFLFNLYPS